jgi:peptidoglycan/xylan/chitin deacetylase (PgdA/CDA1 family)
MRYVARHHTPIALDDWVSAVRAGTSLPYAPVAITIDDGYESTYRLAFPVLREYRIPATVAITTGFVDGREFLWNDRVEWAATHGSSPGSLVDLGWGPTSIDLNGAPQRRDTADHLIEELKRIPQGQRTAAVEALEERVGASLSTANPIPPHYRALSWLQIREMVDSGLVSIANHTRNHYVLSRCSPAEEIDEIEAADQAIRSHLGTQCRTFCFPNGQAGDFTDRTLARLTERGYDVAITTMSGANSPNDNLLEMKRVAVVGETTGEQFRLLLYGGLRGLHRELFGARYTRER